MITVLGCSQSTCALGSSASARLDSRYALEQLRALLIFRLCRRATHRLLRPMLPSKRPFRTLFCLHDSAYESFPDRLLHTSLRAPHSNYFVALPSIAQAHPLYYSPFDSTKYHICSTYAQLLKVRSHARKPTPNPLYRQAQSLKAPNNAHIAFRRRRQINKSKHIGFHRRSPH